MEWIYSEPVRIVFGKGKLSELSNEIKKIDGQKGLIISSPSFVKNGLINKILQANPSIKVVFSEVAPNPDVQECDTCSELIQKNNCDFVIALGGGSVIDCAKAAASFSTTNIKALEYLKGNYPIPAKALPIIAIPTTAGTGSEITSVSVLSDHTTGLKKPLNDPHFFATVAIVDPELTYSVPPYITACTGMDVLCHALEAYWNIHHLPVCDALAVQALKNVFKYLPTAYKQPNNEEAREKMAEASVLAGLAFCVPRTTSSHACSYPLTSMFNIAHGDACGLTIDYFCKINAQQEQDGRINDLAQTLGFADGLALAEAITKLKLELGLLTNLKQYAIDDQKLEELVQASKNPIIKNNPVEISDAILRTMYNSLR